jgi:hypothetical protein
MGGPVREKTRVGYIYEYAAAIATRADSGVGTYPGGHFFRLGGRAQVRDSVPQDVVGGGDADTELCVDRCEGANGV